MAKKIVLIRDSVRRPQPASKTDVFTWGELREHFRRGGVWKHLLRYRKAELRASNLHAMSRPFLSALMLRMLSHGHCRILDDAANRLDITPSVFLKMFWRLLRDGVNKPMLLKQVRNEVETLFREVHRSRPKSSTTGTPVYLRTDLIFGLTSGGSVGHIAGVLNQLGEFLSPPIFLTSDRIPTVSPDVETHIVPPKEQFWDFHYLPIFHYNDTFTRRARQLLWGRDIAFIYQRYCLNNYSGVALSRECNVPFVLEYNGSELWINRNWGNGVPSRYEQLSERIEMLNLRSADVIVVVSEALKEELEARGIERDKILVNPNGVDVQCYSPEVDGSSVRKSLGLENKLVVGFIGTFGNWHGVEVLAEAFGRLLHRRPEFRHDVRLLLIGDGVTMDKVRAALDRWQVGAEAVLTGLIPQEQGPEHLAACDVLVSPHVPNPDGSMFFGSPTKLFEYMAMAKGIVASDLGQIGEILQHGQTALLVTPGNLDELASAIDRLIADQPLRERLGVAARREAESRYTWKEHTRRIVAKIEEVCGTCAESDNRIEWRCEKSSEFYNSMFEL